MKRRLVKLTIALSFVSLALSLNCFAQSQQSDKQAAIKFDEFGDVNISDLKARLDNFAVQLQNQPGTRGFVIAYRSHRDLPGLSSRLLTPIRDYMVNTRGISADRIVTIDGGEASCLIYEFWIVPIGATPKPRSDAYSRHLLDTETAWKFDEYFYPMPQDYGEDDGYIGNSLDGYSDVLRKNPRSQAYVIIYRQYYAGKLDPPSTALTMMKTVKEVLVKTYRITASRIKTVNGGYRRQRQVELWIVPRGEHAPIATPNAFPKRRR